MKESEWNVVAGIRMVYKKNENKGAKDHQAFPNHAFPQLGGGQSLHLPPQQQ